MVCKMVNPQGSYLLFPISQMKQFLDLHLDFFLLDELSPWRWNWKAFSWRRFCEAICFIICTLWLWETPRRLCFSLYQEGRDFSSSWILHSRGLQVSHMPGLFQQGDETLAASHNPSQTRNSQVEKSQGTECMLRNVPPVLREGFSL